MYSNSLLNRNRSAEWNKRKRKFNNNKWFRTDFMCIDGHSVFRVNRIKTHKNVCSHHKFDVSPPLSVHPHIWIVVCYIHQISGTHSIRKGNLIIVSKKKTIFFFFAPWMLFYQWSRKWIFIGLLPDDEFTMIFNKQLELSLIHGVILCFSPFFFLVRFIGGLCGTQ